MTRLALIALSSMVLLHTLPAPARADGERGTSDEARRYAEREAATPRLQDFKGGGCWNPGPWLIFFIPLALVMAPFYLLYKGGEALAEWICPPKKPVRKLPRTPPPAPKSLGLGCRAAACA